METTTGFKNRDEVTGEVWLSNRDRTNQKMYASGSCFIPARASLCAKIAKHLGLEGVPTSQKQLLKALSDKYGIGISDFDFKMLKSDEAVAVADTTTPEAEQYVKLFVKAMKGKTPTAEQVLDNINKCPVGVQEALKKRFLPDLAKQPEISFN